MLGKARTLGSRSDGRWGQIKPSHWGQIRPAFSTRAGIWRLVLKHTDTARQRCPSLAGKNITPHVLRHTAAMRLLRAPEPVDTATIALWLGHETLDSTNKYLHADMELKRRALDRTTPTNAKPGRYRAPDRLLAFLESL